MIAGRYPRSGHDIAAGLGIVTAPDAITCNASKLLFNIMRKTAMEMAVKAKADDVAKKHLGIKRPKGAVKSAGFPKVAKDSQRNSKSLPPRQLY
jgi:hypothetical protein